MEVEEEFAPTSRPTVRYSEPELAEQTQVPRKVWVATNPVIYAARCDVVRRSLKQIMGRDTASQATGATPAS